MPIGTANQAPVLTSGTGLATTDFGSLSAQVRSVVVQADGKIIVDGYAQNTQVRDSYSSELVRYNADGSIDTTFGNSGIVTDGPSSATGSGVALQADGKIVTAGAVFGSPYHFALSRYNSDGSFDASFGTGGKVVTDFGSTVPYGLLIQPDGKIVLAGGADGSIAFGVARFNTDGSFDTSFGTGGKVTTNFGGTYAAGYGAARTPDGKIVVAGIDEFVGTGFDYDFAVARYNNDGSLDTSFGAGGKVTTDFASTDDIPYSVTVQADGKIVAAGITDPGGAANFGLVRYNVDGSLDASFGAGGKVATDFGAKYEAGNGVTIQADGKIIVAGFSFLGSFNVDFALARYNSDGSLDTSFGTGGKITTAFGLNNEFAISLVIQPGGKIVVAGSTTAQSPTGTGADYALVRYNSDGSLDTSFGAAAALGGAVFFTEDGSPTVLNAGATIHDAELDAASYAGASLTLTRHGGADAQDVFGASGALAALTEGGDIVLSGVAIGAVTHNSDGTLVLSFGANATGARVNEAMRGITYANTSDHPAASVQIDWSFSDGNSGAQGNGGAHAAIGSTAVKITAVFDDSPSHDFSGDGKSDILLRSDAGTVVTWDMNDSQVTSTNLISSSPANWNVVGTGDFNGDHKSDILWRSEAGTVVSWDMNDGQVISTNTISSSPANWKVVGTGDFNGDGKSDILWRSEAGTVVSWDMNDGQVISTNVISTSPANWNVVGTGDFNGDGKADILWRSEAGTVVSWDMNDGQVISTNVISTSPANWKVAGTGDFNGDGKSDILWRSEAGTVVTWDMNDAQVTSTNVISSSPANWQIATTGDYNGDGKSDILWRSDAGTVVSWDMNDAQVTSTNIISTIPTDWHII